MEGGDHVRVLVANEPRSYREVIAAAIQALRPLAMVSVVEPAKMDQAVTDRQPHLVVCSQLTALVRSLPFASIMLYPAGSNQVEVRVGQTQTATMDLPFDQLMAVIDQAAGMVGAGQA